MSMSSLYALLPLVILACGVTVIMMQVAFFRGLRATVVLTVLTFMTAALSTLYSVEYTPLAVTPLLQADRLGLLFCSLFCIAAAITALLSVDFLAQREDEPEEYFLLLILSTLGACILACSVHLASLLLGLELMSIALYALIAYPDRSFLPLEAATKYLVLSGAASATALFGFALLYAATGTLAFVEIGIALTTTDTSQSGLLIAAVMIVTGLGFKLSLVPFHLWTPDVYDGAPAPVTGFLASVSKVAVFVVLLRWFVDANLFRFDVLISCMSLIAIFSMLAGNLLALMQTNLKRLLAYSSISHMGYLVIIFTVGADAQHRTLATEAAVFYLIAYTATTLAAFALLALISSGGVKREHPQLRDVSGLLWHRPLVAGMFLLALLSLAGIPLTAGFIAKFYVISAAVSGSHWILLASLVVGSGIGIYYYLRVVYYLARRPEEHPDKPSIPQGSLVRLISCGLIAGILVLGVLPQSLMLYIRSIL
ncbi:MAG: NADH-quinone oxidoreductase subunit N [Halioglobus sp.]